ncbi:MAG TPA: phosphorylase [Terriglobales bacterium]
MAMHHKGIAVVVAMRRELAPLLRGAQGKRAGGVEYFELENAVIVVGGIGRIAAWRAAQAVVARYAPRVLISAGIAGALTTLKVGDVVRGSEVVDADSGARFMASGGESVVVTVSSISGPAGKRILADRYAADVVDMESAVVAAVAREHGIDFSAIKAISDELEFEMPPLARFVDGNGTFETARFAAHVAMRPKWWRPVRQLSANSRTASVNLSHALEHLMKEYVNKTQEEKGPRA